jgi:hypothetical protein
MAQIPTFARSGMPLRKIFSQLVRLQALISPISTVLDAFKSLFQSLYFKFGS